MALLLTAGVASAEPVIPRVAVQWTADAALWRDPGLAAIPFSVRMPLEVTDAGLAAADTRSAALRGTSAKLWIVVSVPDDPNAIDTWRTSLRRWLRAHRTNVSILELTIEGPAAPLVTLAVRTAATELHAAAPDAQLAIAASGGPARLSALITRDLAAYVDLVAAGSVAAAGESLAAVVARAPAVRAVVTGFDLPAARDAAFTTLVREVVATIGTTTVAIAARADAPDAMSGAALALQWLQPLLTGDIQRLDPGASSLAIEDRGGGDVAVPSARLFFDNESLSTLLYYDVPANPSPLFVTVTVPVEGVAKIADMSHPGWRAAPGYGRQGAIVRVEAARSGGPVLVNFNADVASDSFAVRSGVSAGRQLTVEEIIARQRQEQAREDSAVDHYQALVRMEQHFRPTVTDPGYDVLTENRLFVAADGTEWEELSFSVNGSKFGADRPPFPLLQPEKVLSLPLQLRLTDDYRYRLEGTETIDGVECYVVKFDPAQPDRSLYRGTVWIDRRTFVRLKLQTVQTRLSAPVVSSEEIQTFAPVTTPEGARVFLLSRLIGRQIVLIAGRNLLVERNVVLRDIHVNGAGFLESRAEARRGPHVMYRDTDRGLRYFVKQGDTRVVSDRPTMKAKAAALGVTLDPSFAFPLPIFGINYLNFAFGSPDTQLALLFGGVLAAINVQRPNLPHTPFDASVDFFGIAVPSSDRRYDAGGEHPDERVITWPITTGLNLGWQYTPFQKATFQYQFRFDGYHADTTTSEAFVIPASTVTNGFGGAYEYRRGGYSAVANFAWYVREGWREWGLPGDLSVREPTYAKYSGNLSRDFFLSPVQKVHLNGAYFGGRHLDRFSRYQFGLFDDTRIHGVPASGIRFDELAMARGAYTFDLLQLYRFDLFFERAWGRDLSASREWRPITGLGTALNLRAPFTTILRIDVGHAFLPEGYRGVGSTVLQVLILKPLGKS